MKILCGTDFSKPALEAANAAAALDVICLGIQGDTDLSNVLLGSVALAVLKATRRPVFLVRPPKT